MAFMRSSQPTILRYVQSVRSAYTWGWVDKKTCSIILARHDAVKYNKKRVKKLSPNTRNVNGFIFSEKRTGSPYCSPTHAGSNCTPQAPPPSYSALHTGESLTLSIQLDEQSASPLSSLRNISAHLPDTIPLAVPSDHVTAFAGDPREIVAVHLLKPLLPPPT